jgi:hypothetical protein
MRIADVREYAEKNGWVETDTWNFEKKEDVFSAEVSFSHYEHEDGTSFWYATTELSLKYPRKKSYADSRNLDVSHQPTLASREECYMVALSSMKFFDAMIELHRFETPFFNVWKHKWRESE